MVLPTVKRVVRSTLAAEGDAVSEGIEHAINARHLLLDVMGQVDRNDQLPITVYTDNNSLATRVQKATGANNDKRFAIVAASLRKTFAPDAKTPATLKWIATTKMVADALTKMISASLVAFCSAKRLRRPHVNFTSVLATFAAAMSPSVVYAATLDEMCPAVDSVHRAMSTSFFEQTMFFVGVITTIFAIAYGGYLVTARMLRLRNRTAPNHTSFIGDTDEYRKHLREYGHGPFR